METYIPPPPQPLPIPILAICGDADPTVSPDEMDLWREETSEPFRLAIVPGGHFFMNQARAQTIDLVLSQLHLVLAG